MAYSTVAKIRAATGIADGSLVSDDFITDRLQAADEIINDKIADVYQLPLNSTPDLLEFLSIEIASVFLYQSEYGEQVNANGIDPKPKLESAMKILDDIQAQKIKLRVQATGVEFTRTSFLKPTYYPTTAEAGSGTERLFTWEQQF